MDGVVLAESQDPYCGIYLWGTLVVFLCSHEGLWLWVPARASLGRDDRVVVQLR
jgi:hypothetical protein